MTALNIPGAAVIAANETTGHNIHSAVVERMLTAAAPLIVAAEWRALAAEFLDLADKWEDGEDYPRASVYRAEAATLRRRADRLDPSGVQSRGQS